MAFKINDRIQLWDLVGTVLSEPAPWDFPSMSSSLVLSERILVLFDGAEQPSWVEPSCFTLV
jgi:hypothetical protein